MTGYSRPRPDLPARAVKRFLQRLTGEWLPASSTVKNRFGAVLARSARSLAQVIRTWRLLVSVRPLISIDVSVAQIGCEQVRSFVIGLNDELDR